MPYFECITYNFFRLRYIPLLLISCFTIVSMFCSFLAHDIGGLSCFVLFSISILMLFASLVVYYLLHRFPPLPIRVKSENDMIYRRLFAFIIDYLVYFFNLFIVLEMIHSIIFTSSHTLTILEIFAFMSGILCCFAYPLYNQSQSVGQYTLSIRYISAKSDISFLSSLNFSLYAFAGLCGWPLNLFYYSQNQVLWQDGKFGIYPALVQDDIPTMSSEKSHPKSLTR